MRSCWSWSPWALALLLVGCDDTVLVQLRSGPQSFDVDADALAVPAALEDPPGTIASLACGPMGMCPTSEAVPVTCEAGVCDPAPRTIGAPVGDVVDVDALVADAVEVLGTVETIEVMEAEYALPRNELTFDLPEIEIFWGPEGAVAVDPAMGVVQLGTIPPIPAGSTSSGAVALSAEGVGALSDYLVRTSRRVRFFARARVDFAPGDPFPAGSARITVDLAVRVTGSLR